MDVNIFEKCIRDGMILFTTIDPIGTLLLFAALTVGLSARERQKIAIKAVAYSALILIGAVIIGQALLSALGVRLLSLQVAGGVIFFIFGLQMIFGRITKKSSKKLLLSENTEHRDLAVFPLAVPSIASPGAIMAVIILTDNHLYTISLQIVTALIMLGVLTLTLVLMLLSGPILNVIGKSGAAILIRIMGMILAALSIELILEALNIPGWAQGGFNQLSYFFKPFHHYLLG